MTEATQNAAPEPATPNVDARNPWLGLASFTEDTRQFFHGREEEVAELARRVQRKLLTVLFGQSGLGKTSILRAGLVPRLRGQGYCPVYVRIDYGRDAPEPALQIKQAIASVASRSGEWTRAGVAVEGESLWEFLHHRDDVLRDEAGRTLIPLLIFDQFEEIFTLAQSDDFGRARAARFVADLADLVENRPPKEVEARLERDDEAAEKFDFARSDYRVLIALREDYLAPLEGLKTQMPSITQNRLRLAPMTGIQALAAVTRPGGKLVAEEVAAAIVRFVAGGAEIANAEVEPSLLSLICRELNDKRVAEGRSEISLDLLAGSHATILSEFYERSLADQPAAVRRIVEDELLTDSGYRENVAEERLTSDFAAAGAAPGTLALLVNRRLLRIEERLDVRRVELTHDVLCNVVKASRDLRQEREARDRTERLLAEQRERELAARHALVRARQVATACAVLALAALVALGFAYFSAQRARHAEQLAQETRAAAETARTQAEHLLGYLNDDFATALESVGELSLIANLGQKEIEYYESLPASLQSTDTIRSTALARARYGIALQKQYRLEEAAKQLKAAVDSLTRLREAGDTSEEAAIALGLALASQADVLNRSEDGRVNPAVETLNKQAEATLRPYFDQLRPSPAVRRAYGLVAFSVGSYSANDAGLALLERAKKAFASLGALDLSDLAAAGDYVQAMEFQATTLGRLGRLREMAASDAEVARLTQAILERNPAHLIALDVRRSLNIQRSYALQVRQHLHDANAAMQTAAADATLLTRLDPTNQDTRRQAAQTYAWLAQQQVALGHPRAALSLLDQSLAIARAAPRANNEQHFIERQRLLNKAVMLADLGDAPAAAAAAASAAEFDTALLAAAGNDPLARALSTCGVTLDRARIALLAGDAARARALLEENLAPLLAAPADGPYDHKAHGDCIGNNAILLADADNRLGDFAAAERIAERARDIALGGDQYFNPKRHAFNADLQRAIALVRLRRVDEAAASARSALEYARALNAENLDDESMRLAQAQALYVSALVNSAQRGALLREADAIIGKLPAEMQSLRSTTLWRDRIRAELAHPTVAAQARPASDAPGA